MKISDLILPLLLTLFGIGCIVSKKDTASAFSEGAGEGIKTAFSIIPTLVLLMTAISMFSASGCAKIVSDALSPVFEKLGVPSELVPLIVIRPLSGSASTALLTDIFDTYGPDSFISRCASVLSASSDTVFYVTALYMSSAGVKKTRYLLPCAISVMILGVFLSCLLSRLVT